MELTAPNILIPLGIMFAVGVLSLFLWFVPRVERGDVKKDEVVELFAHLALVVFFVELAIVLFLSINKMFFVFNIIIEQATVQYITGGLATLFLFLFTAAHLLNFLLEDKQLTS